MSSPMNFFLAALATGCLASAACQASERLSEESLQSAVSEAFGDYHGCFMLRDLASGHTLAAGSDCAERLPPCSTFKVVSSLMLIEHGLATPTKPRLKWDGRKRSIHTWNRDHDLNSAFAHSVLWFYQRLVPRMGRETIQHSLNSLPYGNRQTGDSLSTFWIDGSLRISPLEQLDLMDDQYLVEFLERLLKTPETLLKRPKFLNDAALDSSQAALEVVKKESIRLYDLSLEVIAQGLGWTKDQLLHPSSLDSPGRVQPPDGPSGIDDAYDNQIKGVFSAIVEFVIRAREKVTGPDAEHLQAYSRGVRDLAEAIKGVKHLQKNLLRYVDSGNPAIAYAYNQLRVAVATVIQSVDEARLMEDEVDVGLNLDHALLTIERDYAASGARIETLIREHSITAGMATSLMADIEYTFETCRNIATMAKLMFTDSGSSVLYSDQGIELGREEMVEILQQDKR